MDNIAEMYVKLKSMRRVAELMEIPVSRVRRELIEECGVLLEHRGLCRAYLVVKGRCFTSITELAKELGISYSNAYYLVRNLVKLVPGLRIAYVDRRIWSIKRIPVAYVVKDTTECRQELITFIKKETGEDPFRWVSWI